MNARELSSQIAAKGAVLHLTVPGLNVLILWWEWIDEHTVYYFEAGAENEFGGHLLQFESAAAPHDLGVEFRNRDGNMIAYLAPIVEAVDDPGTYIATWQAWVGKRNAMADFIEKTKQQLLS